MPLSQREIFQFVIVLCLLLVEISGPTHPLVSANYASNPLMTIDDLFAKPGSFRNMSLMEPHIFLQHVCSYMAVSIHLPRGFLIRDDYAALGFVSRLRKSQITGIMRIFRFILWTNSFDVPVLALLFDQSPSTCYADIHHVAILFVQDVAPHVIQDVVPYSEEYYQLIGAGCFNIFPMCLYAIDVVKVMMNRPNIPEHQDYFDGNHWMYCFGYLLGVDCNGVCRVYNGHLPGAQNDLNNYYSSKLYQEPGLHLGLGCRMVSDGIFARIQPERMIPPICGVRRALTQMEKNYNRAQRQARSIIEHYISRLKGYCPRLRYYTFGIDKINSIFVSCLCLTNIRIKYQDPLRHY